MEKLIKSTSKKFTVSILVLVVFIVAISWGMLEYYNNTEIKSAADISEVQVPAADNPAYAEYLKAEKDYEAHFVTLASSIKEQEAERVTRALAMTAVIVTILGVIAAFIVSRYLMKPVKEAYNSQERFLQDAAHELRNPLAAMSIAIQQADEKTKRLPTFVVFRRQTKRLININEDLLYLERRNKQMPELVNLHELLMDVIEEVKPLSNKKKLNLVIKSDENINKVISSNDYIRLVKNLLDNAVKYSKPGKKIAISQKIEKKDIVFTIKDQGIGIPEKDLKNIGDRFFRAKNTGKIEGTGLGIAIVNKILNTYGGDIEFTSKVGKGTTVKVYLPE